MIPVEPRGRWQERRNLSWRGRPPHQVSQSLRIKLWCPWIVGERTFAFDESLGARPPFGSDQPRIRERLGTWKATVPHVAVDDVRAC